jgi:hypothetical protein
VANASGSYNDVDGCNPCEEADLYETAPPVPSPAAEGKRNKVAGRVKQSNFLPDEDVNLVKSWLEISCDAVTSNGQKRNACGRGFYNGIIQGGDHTPIGLRGLCKAVGTQSSLKLGSLLHIMLIPFERMLAGHLMLIRLAFHTNFVLCIVEI